MTSSAAPTATRMVELVFPDQTNHHGNLFGGTALGLMDKTAFVVATRHGRRTMVTAATDHIDFRTPVRLGQMVELVGEPVRVGRSSMTVAVELWAEDLLTGGRELCTRGEFVMVVARKEERGEPLPLAPGAAPVPDPTETRVVEIVFPGQTNHQGLLLGGHALSLMGKVAFVAATRHARKVVVMAASDRIDFHAPVRQGELVEFAGRIEHVGRSSMVVAVTMEAEDLLTGRRRLCTEGRFTMVALGDDGRPAPVPPLAAT